MLDVVFHGNKLLYQLRAKQSADDLMVALQASLSGRVLIRVVGTLVPIPEEGDTWHRSPVQRRLQYETGGEME